MKVNIYDPRWLYGELIEDRWIHNTFNVHLSELSEEELFIAEQSLFSRLNTATEKLKSICQRNQINPFRFDAHLYMDSETDVDEFKQGLKTMVYYSKMISDLMNYVDSKAKK